MNDIAHHHHEHARDQQPPGSESPLPEKPYTDPVCGMKVAGDPNKTVQYEGRTYHFCSERCRDRFRASPEAYVAATRPEPAAGAPEGTIYTCPMHPEVRQPAPGNCPKCGMALEPEMPSLKYEENPELADFRRRFWWTLPLTVVATLMAMLGHRLVHGGLPQQSWLELLLTTPVILWAGWPFFVRGVQSIRNRSPNMWTLIGLGVTAAYAYSVVAAVAPGVFSAQLRD